MDDIKKEIGNSFEEMFGGATEFVPDPMDYVEGEFDSLDEEDGGGEDELADVDCTDIVQATDEELENNTDKDEDEASEEDSEEEDIEDDTDFAPTSEE